MLYVADKRRSRKIRVQETRREKLGIRLVVSYGSTSLALLGVPLRAQRRLYFPITMVVCAHVRLFIPRTLTPPPNAEGSTAGGSPHVETRQATHFAGSGPSRRRGRDLNAAFACSTVI